MDMSVMSRLDGRSMPPRPVVVKPSGARRSAGWPWASRS